VNAIVDPFTEAPYCGVCGAAADDLAQADECCASPPVYRQIIAGALVLIAMIYLFALLPFIA
jgi:hypothetical protein